MQNERVRLQWLGLYLETVTIEKEISWTPQETIATR